MNTYICHVSVSFQFHYITSAPIMHKDTHECMNTKGHIFPFCCCVGLTGSRKQVLLDVSDYFLTFMLHISPSVWPRKIKLPYVTTL